jgi:hypothetical protein
MLLRERVLEQPGVLIASCLVWVPIMIWIWAMLSWTIQGDIDFTSGLAGSVLGIGIGLIAMITRDDRLPILILLAEVVTLIAFPIVRSVLNRHMLNAIEVEAIERTYDLLADKPGNPGLMFRLAKNLYARGMVSPAIAIAEDALQHMPKVSFEEEHGIVRGWTRRAKHEDLNKPMPCFDCGAENPPNLIHCPKCGSPHLLEYARGRWMGRGVARKLIAAWAALMVGIVGIPWASMSLPPVIAIVAILLMMAGAVALLLFAFRHKETPLAA